MIIGVYIEESRGKIGKKVIFILKKQVRIIDEQGMMRG